MNKAYTTHTKILLAVLVLAFIIAMDSMYILEQRKSAMILQFGEVVSRETTPGLKFKIPLIQKVKYFDNRILHVDSGTKEVIAAGQKQVLVDAFAKFRIVDPLLFYQSAGTEEHFKSRLSGIFESSLRQVLGGAPFKSLLTSQRKELMDKVKEVIDREARSFGVEIVDVRIVRTDLPDKSRDAVFQRMITDRKKEADENRAKGREEAEKIRAQASRESAEIIAAAKRDAETIKGEADAEVTRLYAKTFGQDVDFFEFYRSMDAYKKVLDARSTTLVLTPDNPFLKYLNKKNGAM